MSLFESIARLFRPGRSLADLARWLDKPEASLRLWLGKGPGWEGHDYRQFRIPKRSGGWRAIDAPSGKLKALQRLVLRRLLNPLKLHPAATGFARGRSIVDNARPHAGQGVVINLDLQDFFPAITADRVRRVWRGLGWGAEAADVLTRICTHAGRLPQGAPTSPALSNLACRRLDERLAALARKTGGAYTRYADDLTFSFPGLGRNRARARWPRGQRAKRRPARGPSRSLLTLVREIIEDEGFKIQLKKRIRLQRAHQRQTATGLVVNRTVNLPRAARRLIRAMQHRRSLGQLDAAAERRLRGLEALQAMVERQR